MSIRRQSFKYVEQYGQSMEVPKTKPAIRLAPTQDDIVEHLQAGLFDDAAAAL